MMKLQAFWRVAFLVLFQFIARKGSGGVFAADFLSKKSGEQFQFPGAAACDKELLALLFPEAYGEGSDSAAGQDNAAQRPQTAAAFGNFYISIPFDSPQLQSALNCYKGFPTYMMPNVDGDSSVMPKNHSEFIYRMVQNALQQEIEPEAPSGGDAPLATPAATTGTDTELVTRTTVREAISREKAKAEKQGAGWEAGWTPDNWDPEKFHFATVTEMLAGLEKNMANAVDWAAGPGAGGGDEGSRNPADVLNVVYQIMVEPAGLDPGQGPNTVRSDGCKSAALDDLQNRHKEETLLRAQQIICKSDLWMLVHLWKKNPSLFLDDGQHGVGGGGLHGAGPRGATSKARTTWRLEFVLPTWLSHEKSEDVVGNNMKVITYTAPRESFRSEEELRSLQRAFTFMPQLGEKLKWALKAKEGGRFSNTPEPELKRTQPEQTLLLRTKEFAGSGSEAAISFTLGLYTCPRWDRHPTADMPRPKAALVIGTPVMARAAERFRGFNTGSGGADAEDESFYGEHQSFYDSLDKSIQVIVPEWRLFGNWQNDGRGSSELFQSGITKLLNKNKGAKHEHRQGIPYKQSHDLALAAPTK